MLKIAVTGANGFVGTALCALLASKPNLKITQLIRHSNHSSTDSLNINASDEEIIHELQNYDCLIHLAARAHTNNSTEADFRRDNIELSERLARISARAKITQFIYLSSIKVLGNTTEPNKPFSWASKPCPEDIYGQSKLDSEKVIARCLDASSTALTIVRPPLVWGANCKGNLRTLINLINYGFPLPLAGLKNSRDIISLENLCDFLTHIILDPKAYNATFLVSDEKKRSTTDIIQLLEIYASRNAKLVKMPQVIVKGLRILPSFRAKMSSIYGNLELDTIHTKTTLNWTPKN